MNYLVVGLGNPTDKYKNTRHNVGFIILDELVGENDWSKCNTCNSLYKKEDNLMYLKPQTMMNRSGEAVYCRAKKHYKI